MGRNASDLIQDHINKLNNDIAMKEERLSLLNNQVQLVQNEINNIKNERDSFVNEKKKL